MGDSTSPGSPGHVGRPPGHGAPLCRVAARVRSAHRGAARGAAPLSLPPHCSLPLHRPGDRSAVGGRRAAPFGEGAAGPHVRHPVRTARGQRDAHQRSARPRSSRCRPGGRDPHHPAHEVRQVAPGPAACLDDRGPPGVRGHPRLHAARNDHARLFRLRARHADHRLHRPLHVRPGVATDWSAAVHGRSPPRPRPTSARPAPPLRRPDA